MRVKRLLSNRSVGGRVKPGHDDEKFASGIWLRRRKESQLWTDPRHT